MTKNDFIARLETIAGRNLTDFELDQLQIAFGNVTEFVDISEVNNRFAAGKVGYWLYDKATKTWVINMKTGSHEIFAGTLYNIQSDEELWEEDAAEKYIREHYGFFVSGVMNMYIPIKDELYILSAEEVVFDKAKGHLNWRGIRN